MRAIETKHRGDLPAALREILQLWLGGKGVGVSWGSLVETLRDVELNVLAAEVEKYVAEKK